MSIWEILLTGIGLSMDAFAVSICKGLTMKRMNWRNAVTAGLYFGAFQALMPTIGYFAGRGFYRYIEKVDHWIVFIILALIGLSMIREAAKEDPDKANDDFSPAVMIPLAIATSIDAFAVGISMAFLKVDLIKAVTLIGCTTFCFGFAGIRIGRSVGGRFGSRAEMAGGIILILIGTHVLLQHLGLISF